MGLTDGIIPGSKHEGARERERVAPDAKFEVTGRVGISTSISSQKRPSRVSLNDFPPGIPGG